jgi:membrane associated rhomboid family serine protease/Flp pilus assembly protein TadD
MLHCACCGDELHPSFPNEENPLCSECRHAMATGEDVSPLPTMSRAQRAPVNFPITNAIILLNFAVFSAMGFRVHGSTDGELVRWGASWGPLSLGSEWWRIFSSMFVHNGLAHLVGNMGTLWVAGKMAERIFGKWSFLLLYFISGVAGTVLSLAAKPEALSAGASGAVFGIMGAVLVALFEPRFLELSNGLKRRFWPLLIFTAYIFYAGCTDHDVDNTAHVGGLLSGLIITFVLTRLGTEPARQRARLFTAVTTILISAILVVRHENEWVGRIGSVLESFAENRLDDATGKLSAVLREHPNDVLANVIMGDIYIREGNYVQAEMSLRHALATDPHSNAAERLVGLVYLKTGRFDEALDCTTRLMKNGDFSPEAQALFADALEGKGNHALAGHEYFTLRRYDDAITSFEKALKQKPDDEASKHGLAEAYRAKGMNDEADSIEGSTSPSNLPSQPQPKATPRL